MSSDLCTCEHLCDESHSDIDRFMKPKNRIVPCKSWISSELLEVRNENRKWKTVLYTQRKEYRSNQLQLHYTYLLIRMSAHSCVLYICIHVCVNAL